MHLLLNNNYSTCKTCNNIVNHGHCYALIILHTKMPVKLKKEFPFVLYYSVCCTAKAKISVNSDS